MPTLTLTAPAKINLFLQVTGRRPDGYHDLQTVFRLLAMEDTVHLRPRRDGALRMVSPTPGVAPEDDLCLRAARTLKRATGCRRGAELLVEKRIPQGSGLGGGSSDAASVLIGLNRLWALGLEAAELAQIGAGLGADVPVFVHGRSAWGEGTGDRLTPLALEPAWYVLVFPPLSISTSAVFRDPLLKRDRRPITLDEWRADPATMVNDCEPVVLRRYPEMAVVHSALAAFGEVRMSGTGSTFFLEFQDYQTAREVGSEIGRRYNVALTSGRDC